MTDLLQNLWYLRKGIPQGDFSMTSSGCLSLSPCPMLLWSSTEEDSCSPARWKGPRPAFPIGQRHQWEPNWEPPIHGSQKNVCMGYPMRNLWETCNYHWVYICKDIFTRKRSRFWKLYRIWISNVKSILSPHRTPKEDKKTDARSAKSMHFLIYKTWNQPEEMHYTFS